MGCVIKVGQLAGGLGVETWREGARTSGSAADGEELSEQGEGTAFAMFC